MPLEFIIPPDLSGSVFSGDPERFRRRNVFYVPKNNSSSDSDFGLFEETGRQILSNALFQGHPGVIKTQKLSTRLNQAGGYGRLSSAIYGGVINRHYGHFITECLNTLWYYGKYGTESDKVLFHSPMSQDELFEISWIAEFLEFCGLKRDQVIVPSSPVIFDELMLPGQAFSEGSFAYEGFAEFCNKVGVIAAKKKDIDLSRPIFLTRSKLTNGTLVFDNEDQLVECLQNEGFSVVVPEVTSVANQIAIFRSGQIVSGIYGSSFHTSIFSENARGIAISGQPFVSRSYHLMDAVNRADVRYVTDTRFHGIPAPPGFTVGRRFNDPKESVKELSALIDQFNNLDRAPMRRSLLARSEYAGRRNIPSFSKPEERTFQIQPLKTLLNQYIFVNRITGDMNSQEDHENKLDIVQVLIINCGRVAILVADVEYPLPLSIIGEQRLSPSPRYELLDFGQGIFALRNPDTQKFLCAPPEICKEPLRCTADVVRQWEKYEVVRAGGGKTYGMRDWHRTAAIGIAK
jgi:hypothetical protein